MYVKFGVFLSINNIKRPVNVLDLFFGRFQLLKVWLAEEDQPGSGQFGRILSFVRIGPRI